MSVWCGFILRLIVAMALNEVLHRDNTQQFFIIYYMYSTLYIPNTTPMCYQGFESGALGVIVGGNADHATGVTMITDTSFIIDVEV